MSTPKDSPPLPQCSLHAGPPVSICILASGSKGNAIYVSSGKTTLLVDAGLSGVETERRLKARGLLPAQVDAIVLSHEHNDHLSGVGVLARRYGLPVYMSARTENEAARTLGSIPSIEHFSCGTGFAINDIAIHPFSTSHDACDPAGFTFRINGCKIGLATDMGIATRMVVHHLRDCACLILEANHDPRMLEAGPYPWPTKQRIKSRTGHLSNEESKALLMEVCHEGLDHVILAHLSEKNNSAEKALSVISERLPRKAPKVSVALQHEPTPLIRLYPENQGDPS